MGVVNPQSWGRGGCRLSNSHSSYVTVQNGHLEHGDAAAEIKRLHVRKVYYSVVGLKICTIHSLSLLKLYFFLLPFHALSSFLVRHFHVLHFHNCIELCSGVTAL